jgi:DNA-binding beta-propeller fold protein YncE
VKALIPVAGGSEDVELNADGSLLFITSREQRILHVVDTATLEEIKQIEVNERPGRLTLTTDGKLVVSHFNVRLPNGVFLQGLLSIVDPDELKVVHWIYLGRAPHDLATSHDGRLAYVAHGHSGTLFEVDLDTVNIKRVVEVGVGTHGVVLL